MSLMESEVGQASGGRAVIVFFSYADKDKSLRDQLEEHLSILKYRKLITSWYDRNIMAGDDWEREIYRQLEQASIVLLLISPSFMSSPYCYSVEMEYALRRHERGEARVLPVLLRPVLITGAPFAKLRVLPTNGKAVTTWRNRDSAFVEVAIEIERIVQERLAWHTIASPDQAASSEVFSKSPAPAVPPMPIQSGQMAPPLPPIQVSRLQEQARRRQYEKALALHEREIRLNSANMDAHRGKGDALVELGRYEEAIAAYAQALALDPSAAPAYRGISAALTWLGKLQEAELAEARARQIEEAQERERQERTYYEQALAACEQALRQNSTDARAYRGKGNALVGLKRYGEALAAFKQAVFLVPQSITYVNMGDALELLGRHNEALAAYIQALTLDATSADAYTGMSKALMQLGRVQEAERSVKTCFRRMKSECEENTIVSSLIGTNNCLRVSKTGVCSKRRRTNSADAVGDGDPREYTSVLR